MTGSKIPRPLAFAITSRLNDSKTSLVMPYTVDSKTPKLLSFSLADESNDLKTTLVMPYMINLKTLRPITYAITIGSNNPKTFAYTIAIKIKVPKIYHLCHGRRDKSFQELSFNRNHKRN